MEAIERSQTEKGIDITMDPLGDDWDGSLEDVGELRCDGLIELAYEWNDIMVWGMKDEDSGQVHYDMEVESYLAEHSQWQWGVDPSDGDSDMWAYLLPVTQGGFADAYISEHYDYSGPKFRGNSWQTTFVEQTLVFPEVLSPEKDDHY